jgi:hypothetical protein
MFAFLFPKTIDNTYPGPKWTLGVFGVVTLLTLWRSVHHIVAEDGGAQSIATIPLDQFSSDAQAVVIGMFALWGLSQLLLALVMVLVGLRYRRLIPFFWVLVALEYIGRIWIGQAKPIPTVGTAPGAMGNLPLLVLALVMLLILMFEYRKTGKV